MFSIIAKNTQNEYIFEVESSNTPSISEYSSKLSGCFLFISKDKWIFPFIKNKINLNIKKIIIPDNSISIISVDIKSDEYSKIEFNPIIFSDYLEISSIVVKSKKLIPFKIKRNSCFLEFRIIKTLECLLIEN